MHSFLVTDQGSSGWFATWPVYNSVVLVSCFVMFWFGCSNMGGKTSLGCSQRLWSIQNPTILMEADESLDEPEHDSDYSESEASSASSSGSSSESGAPKASWFLQGSLFAMLSPSPRPCPVHSLSCLGIQVCRLAWLQILGIGRERLSRCKKNFRGMDLRGLGTWTWSFERFPYVLAPPLFSFEVYKDKCLV